MKLFDKVKIKNSKYNTIYEVAALSQDRESNLIIEELEVYDPADNPNVELNEIITGFWYEESLIKIEE